jgi:NADPH:quinone reductase-like Zn-dependent oxidoreductase
MMRAVRFAQYGPPQVLCLEEIETQAPALGDALVQIRAAAINPSDVKNVAGAFHASLPRTPGRDYAGIVVEGEGKGREVWGSGPGFGVERDGSHAEFVVMPGSWLSDKPAHLPFDRAAAIGVPFIVAFAGLSEASLQAGETILVTGALGAVGRAVTQIARWKGARVIGSDIVERPSDLDVFISAKSADLAAEVKTATNGKGVDLVYDTVGGPTFERGLKCLRVLGRQVVIASAGERRVSFDLIDFYHNRLRIIGLDSLKLGGTEIAAIMDALKPGFESHALKPYDVKTWPLADAVAAYSAVEKGGGSEKHVLVPAAR